MNYGVTDGLESGDMSYGVTNELESGGMEYAITDGAETGVMTDGVTDGPDSDRMNYAVANGLESGEMSHMVENGLIPADNRTVANAKAPKTIDLSRIEWKWNGHKNKLVPKDATDDEGGGSASARSADSRVHLVHVWVRGNGTGLAVVDSYETDLAGKVLNLGDGIRPELAYRGRTNPIRYVANLSTGNVEDLKEGMDEGDAPTRSTRVSCIEAVEVSQTTFPPEGGTFSMTYRRTGLANVCVTENSSWTWFGDDVDWISFNRRASCEKRVRPSFCLRPRGERGSADGTQRSQDDSDRHCGRGAGAAGVHGACLPVMRASTREEMRRISSTSRSSSRLFSIHSR